MDYTNEQIKAAAECCVKPFNCPMCPLKHTGCGAILATRLLALESENADLKKQLAESEKREKAMIEQHRGDCQDCANYRNDKMCRKCNYAEDSYGKTKDNWQYRGVSEKE